MKNPQENYPVYVRAMELFDKVWDDTDILIKDIRGIEITQSIQQGVSNGKPYHHRRQGSG